MPGVYGNLYKETPMSKIKAANKALVAALGAAITAAAPAVITAVNEWVAAVIGLVLTGAITWRVPNKPEAEG